MISLVTEQSRSEIYSGCIATAFRSIWLEDEDLKFERGVESSLIVSIRFKLGIDSHKSSILLQQQHIQPRKRPLKRAVRRSPWWTNRKINSQDQYIYCLSSSDGLQHNLSTPQSQ